MIPSSFIEEVQAKTDIVELISSYIPLKRTGRNFKALCPFHNEKTPSFHVSPQKQIFHCFGCGEGGGPVQFLMLYEKVTFPEAIEILAKKLGLEIPYQRTSPEAKFKPLLYDVVYEASIFFHKNLFEHPQGQFACEYLIKRGVDKEIIKQFRIGYALGRNSLMEYMRKKGFSLETLEKASLVVSKQEGGYVDLFRRRIVFPIFDVRSRVIGFGARTLEEKEGIPKYLNSLENPLYSKREHLFGLNFSKDEIVKKDSVVVVEGYFDMIIPYVKGIKNIVASLGTSLTTEQIRVIKRYTNNVILVFDSDKAGELATLRAVDLLLENGLKVNVVEMPSGFDPDLAMREKGAEYFLECLKRGVTFFDYKVGVLKNIYDVKSIEGKTKIANEMFLTLNKMSSEVEKYEYIKKLASILEVKEEILTAELRKLKKINPNRQKLFLEKIKRTPIPIQEKTILKFMVTQKRGCEIIKKRLKEDDFTHPLVKKTVSFLFNYAGGDNERVPNNFLGLIEDKEIRGFISQLLIEEEDSWDKNFLKECILKLQRNRARVIRESLRKEIEEAESKGDKKRLKELILRYKKIERKGRYG